MGSTLARRALGRKLNTLREQANFSKTKATRILGISCQTMSRLEDGLSVPSASDLYMNTLCDHYGVNDDTRRTILALATEVRATAKYGGGWWRAHMDHKTGDFDPYASAEEAATRTTVWSTVLVPRIVRTLDYSRAVAWAESPNAPTDDIEERVSKSLEYQRRLDGSDRTFEFLIFEAALREEWGGPAVMAEQRRYLAEASERPNISIRIVPFDARSHLGALVGPFTLLEFPLLPHTKFVEPPLVRIEEHVGTLYLERPEEVSRYQTVLAELRRVAMTKTDSTARLLTTTPD
ncbi:Scr1 family TA system antitoxin-like transcriptional regulator [Nocardia sp. NPDC004068]|uniref:Scr1 family TA system antitoxin-like transcriptional regulator n=1 Tax=Nocardia sp. NPDC004068 TaxID=3364303 RepID=UPI00368C5EF3